MNRLTWTAVALGVIAMGCSAPAGTGGPPAVPESQLGDDRRVAPPDPNAPSTGSVSAELGEAPGGSVFHPDGTELDLSSTYAETNAVIVFYRGHW